MIRYLPGARKGASACSARERRRSGATKDLRPNPLTAQLSERAEDAERPEHDKAKERRALAFDL
jgi:hypothetical protein